MEMTPEQSIAAAVLKRAVDDLSGIRCRPSGKVSAAGAWKARMDGSRALAWFIRDSVSVTFWANACGLDEEAVYDAVRDLVKRTGYQFQGLSALDAEIDRYQRRVTEAEAARHRPVAV